MQFTSPRFTARLTGYGLLALVAAACSSDPSRIAGPASAEPAARNVAPAGPIVAVDGGAFVAFLANNSGRASTEFWDNFSADNTAGSTSCNIGFYAAGTLVKQCLDANVRPGTYDNVGTTTYSQYLATGGKNAAGFLFDGDRTYTLKVEGSIAGAPSEIGYFYGNTYVPIDNFGTGTVGSTIVIGPAQTGGADWGLYIKNDFNAATGGCRSDTDCSNAIGGQPQQFALFANPDFSKYLVGVEDNTLGLFPNTAGNGFQLDSDYNDFIISVTPAPLPQGGQGCTPGFWKNTLSRNWATTGYSPNQLFSSVFENAFPGKTLAQVLDGNGGGLDALGRHTVAALLNAASSGVSYQYSTGQVIAKFNNAVPGGNYESLKNDFESYNTDGCPLNNGRG